MTSSKSIKINSYFNETIKINIVSYCRIIYLSNEIYCFN